MNNHPYPTKHPYPEWMNPKHFAAWEELRITHPELFARWFKKHGKTPFLLKSRYRVLQIEKDIKALLQIPVEDA